ncbi:MAG: Lacal_2735 family protein [Oceanospirillales bacterium]|nr:Lacal_2735 family protein [Oceanospirillales bacterium]MBR9888618.1 Lacal_2735 family protein [Oceanospirillales bacterium]
MFSIFKSNPAKKLDKLYRSKLEEAMHAQRNGNIEGYSQLSTEADAIYKQILELKKAE